MIKLNNICIQYTAWCRRIREIDPRNGIGESHSPGSVACGYPDRSITRVGVSKQELPTYPPTRLRDRSIEYRRDGSDVDVSHAIDPPGGPLSSSIGRFWRRRMAGRYSRHTFELQCKRTSVEPYTYSMLLYLK
ncbi:hypothetical protein ALC60_02062 [Trachymyrmex zeteki]|uniref:Uncharacterized protein n=1 Tax=Mycetomoellerius zeteki TaxID=64791 RepID=A0A151XET4_9HYME|nr:hypothetical protein ALC60_02062 [Trachymyrmex zeteki]